MGEQTKNQKKKTPKLKTTSIVKILYETDKNSKWRKNIQSTGTHPLLIYLYKGWIRVMQQFDIYNMALFTGVQHLCTFNIVVPLFITRDPQFF